MDGLRKRKGDPTKKEVFIKKSIDIKTAKDDCCSKGKTPDGKGKHQWRLFTLGSFNNVY